MDEETAARVRAIVAGIPAGEVLSYGEVAGLAGLPSPRMVGRLLWAGDGVPWHRVVRADGRLAPHVAARQAELLRAEGIEVVDSRIVRPRRTGS